VDWARACGFKVVAAGKGTRYHPSYHRSTPETVWEILDQYMVIKDRSHINPKMFNSFVDGTKSGIEMTAVCNADLPKAHGLSLPASASGLAMCKPKSEAELESRRDRGHLVADRAARRGDISPWALKSCSRRAVRRRVPRIHFC
jgi:predicted homoserine dehydrogenase-like protein